MTLQANITNEIINYLNDLNQNSTFDPRRSTTAISNIILDAYGHKPTVTRSYIYRALKQMEVHEMMFSRKVSGELFWYTPAQWEIRERQVAEEETRKAEQRNLMETARTRLRELGYGGVDFPWRFGIRSTDYLLFTADDTEKLLRSLERLSAEERGTDASRQGGSDQRKCAHGCGKPVFDGQVGNYCDWCYADQCLVGPDGECRYTIVDEWDGVDMDSDDD